ncbi:MAG: hypothetical protein ACRC2T_15790, partial [Thermoguttaceae bacterium]
MSKDEQIKQLSEQINSVLKNNPSLMGSTEISDDSKQILKNIIGLCNQLIKLEPNRDTLLWTLSVKLKAHTTLYRVEPITKTEQ